MVETSSAAVDYYDASERIGNSDAVLAKLALRASLTNDSAKLILAMVGLPARGKSFISHKLSAFLSWIGYQTQIFNAGQKRRRESTVEEAVMERKRSEARCVRQRRQHPLA